MLASKKARFKALNNLLSPTYNVNHHPEIAQFISRYIDCEIIARRLIRFFKRDKEKRQVSSLYLPTLRRATTYFDIDVSEALLSGIFAGGEGKRGEKSARQLRNGYVHKKSPQDCEEMLANFNSWITLMDTFLDHCVSHFAS